MFTRTESIVYSSKWLISAGAALLSLTKGKQRKAKQNKKNTTVNWKKASALLFHADGAVYQLSLRAGRRPKPRCITAGSN